MNEMEFSLQQAKLEQDAKIRVAQIEADAKVKVAKKQNRLDIYWNGVIGGVIAMLTVLGGVGGAIYQHVNYTNKYAQQIERCEQAGGTWTPRLQRVYVGHSNEQDEWYEICVKP